MNESRAVKIFGKAVREIRQERGLTLEALATEIDIDAAHLSRIERGQKEISLATAVRIADALGEKLTVGKYTLKT
ncbi:MAG TPA: helix-turn-helix transcriptional regulator [Candidatus Obscuribacterales bacterium]